MTSGDPNTEDFQCPNSIPTVFRRYCAEAMRFYERTLGGKLQMMMKNSEGQTTPSFDR